MPIASLRSARSPAEATRFTLDMLKRQWILAFARKTEVCGLTGEGQPEELRGRYTYLEFRSPQFACSGGPATENALRPQRTCAGMRLPPPPSPWNLSL